jgi:phosphatidylserine/phosphatidylglycerophosphate/cardiolipin synthase-like enzyme
VKFRRALLVVNLGQDVARHVAVLRRVAPGLQHLHVVAELQTSVFAWLFGERAAESDDETTAQLAALRLATDGAAASVDVEAAPELGSEALAALCVGERIDLLVFPTRSLRSAWAVSAERDPPSPAVLWSEGEPGADPLRELACVALDDRSRGALRAFLRDHADPSMHVTLLSPSAVPPDVVTTTLQVSGIDATVDVSSLRDAPSVQQWIDEWTRDRPVDLLVVSGIPTALLLSALRAVPVLLLPPLPVVRPFGQRAIDVPDLLDEGAAIRVLVDHVATVGSLEPIPDQPLAWVSGGRVVATVTTRGGEAELPAGLGLGSVGVYRVGETAPVEPLAAVEEQVAVMAAGERALVAFDCEIADEALRDLAELTGPAATDVVAVRLRPTRSCRAIRERMRAAELPARVLDARLVLDEGEALDVSEALDAVRLVRVAAKLKSAGFPVTAIVHRGEVAPVAQAFDVLTASDLVRDSSVVLFARPTRSPASVSTVGNRIELELDNATARRWLLRAISESTKTLHFQVYMALDDDVGGPVEAALAAAGARGVAVRVLVDSLHGLHGSFGAKNPLLERLSARPGVELRALMPITDLPSVADLKVRDHRKLVVADGRVALLGGRNLSHEYYTGFDEVRIDPASQWRLVPWLDSGARVEGPAVTALERSFLETWVEAGGAAFAIAASQPAGVSQARVVVHRGLRDANTLETYRELIETARSHVYVVTGFPLVLELQHALLSALRRGVRVRTLIGYATPMHGGQPFGGPWATARTVATELVHSRLDPIVAAGGETYVFARHGVHGWAPELGIVHPHVHAKAMSVDGRRCIVGSANMDITASYWESELMLLVEDPALARGLEAEIAALMAGSTPVSRDDPAWQRLAERRTWMRHWPGVLSA